jgi:NAD dependent epimerase/dehydratase family enzyme
MGTETMLYSQRAYPEVLRTSGFEWQYDDLDDVLFHELITARSDSWGNTTSR